MTNDQFTEWLESRIAALTSYKEGQLEYQQEETDIELNVYDTVLNQYRQLAPTWIPVTPDTMPDRYDRNPNFSINVLVTDGEIIKGVLSVAVATYNFVYNEWYHCPFKPTHYKLIGDAPPIK